MEEGVSPWTRRVRSAWNARAEAWDLTSRKNDCSADRAADLERIWNALHLGPGSTVLDAGCGTGQFAIPLARRGCHIVGVDIADEMIERARRNASDAGVGVDFRVVDISNPAVPAESLDAIFARVVLQFVSNVAETLGEFARALKPDGRLLVSVPGALSPIYFRSWMRFIEPDSSGNNLINPWEIERLLAHLGWSIVEQWGDYGTNLEGEPSAFGPEEMSQLHRMLQQAAATTWTIVACRPDLIGEAPVEVVGG